MSKRENIAVYICSKNIYPSDEINKWSLGDLSEEEAKRLPKKIYMRDQLTTSNPFMILPAIDKVMYYPHFNFHNLDFFLPDFKLMLEANKLG